MEAFAELYFLNLYFIYKDLIINCIPDELIHFKVCSECVLFATSLFFPIHFDIFAYNNPELLCIFPAFRVELDNF